VVLPAVLEEVLLPPTGEDEAGDYADRAKTGRVMTINLHPYLIGIPYHVKYLGMALEHMAKRSAVWSSTGKEIIEWYAAHHG
jgi:hypothetical protein